MTPRVELMSTSGMEVESIHLALAACARTACGFARLGVVSVEPVSDDCVRVTHTYWDDSRSFTLLIDRDTWMGALRSRMA
jgi:heme-degrading monooxygenase HmoA